VNAEAARFVTRRTDHAALVALPADNHRKPAQFGPRQQFHGNEKRIHINVEYRGDGFRGGGGRRAMLRAKMSQFRHVR